MEKHKLLEDWNIVKEDFHNLPDSKLRPLREGEVWWIIPLSSQEHVGPWYINFSFQNKMQTAVLSQARVYSTSRLYSRMEQVPESDLEKVRAGFLALYSK